MLLRRFLKYPFSTSKLVNFSFKNKDGSLTPVAAKLGQHLLEIAHQNDIDLEGACEASLACSTCHVILDQNVYDTLPEIEDEENDLLDLAFGVTYTSRLGCQVHVTEDFEGTVITLPKATRNFYVDKK